jgi:hypothetical protein
MIKPTALGLGTLNTATTEISFPDSVFPCRALTGLVKTPVVARISAHRMILTTSDQQMLKSWQSIQLGSSKRRSSSRSSWPLLLTMLLVTDRCCVAGNE